MAKTRGEEAELDSALERAADLLDRARFPILGGLFTDIGGAAAALSLAEKLGGVIDHAASTGLMRASKVMRETGATPASFGEIRNRADTVVVIGKAPLARDPDLVEKLFPAKPGLPRPGDNKRELILLGAGKAGTDKHKTPKHVRATAIDSGAALPELVALLAASLRQGRFDPRDKALAAKIDAAAARLRKSAFAVFVYDPAEIEEPVLHTVLEMVRHLVLTTRAAILSLAAPGNGDGVNLCSTWTCGLPVRTSFARDVPQHDAWAYDTGRLLKSGEADALVWIDALDGATAARPKGGTAVVLSANPDRGAKNDIVIEVASAAGDHDAALFLPPISGIGMVKAVKANKDKPTAAAVLTRIAELIDERRAA
jgi:formylmethanofuran dehydrogenase subunit B